jgi:hypothetical protein
MIFFNKINFYLYSISFWSEISVKLGRSFIVGVGVVAGVGVGVGFGSGAGEVVGGLEG